MRKLIIEKMYIQPLKHIDESQYFQTIPIVLVINGKAYSYSLGELDARKNIDLQSYEGVPQLEEFKKKYGELEITELRYDEWDLAYHMFICHDLLFYSEYLELNGLRLHNIGFIDNIRDVSNEIRFRYIMENSEEATFSILE